MLKDRHAHIHKLIHATDMLMCCHADVLLTHTKGAKKPNTLQEVLSINKPKMLLKY